MPTPSAVPGPRERLLTSTIALVREHGVEAMGTAELLAHSKSARGSIYQHFPGGKEELVEAATRMAGGIMAGGFTAGRLTTAADAATVVTQLVDGIKRGLTHDDYALGCPIVAAAVAGPEHPAAVAAAADVFAEWVSRLTQTVTATGVEPKAAVRFASLVVSALEGALLRARAARDPQALDDAADQLALLARCLPAQSPPPNSTSTES